MTSKRTRKRKNASTPAIGSNASPAPICAGQDGAQQHAPYLTVGQVAELMNVSRKLVYKAIYAGELPCVRFMAAVRVPREMLDAYLSRSKKPPAEMPRALKEKATKLRARASRSRANAVTDWREVLGLS